MNEAGMKLPPEYMAREERLMKAAALTKPDRVPVMPLNILYYANRAQGVTNAEAQTDYVKRFELMKKITLDLGQETMKYLEAANNYFMHMAVLGYPISWPAGTFTAFDVVSHDLRGMKGTVLDMYRQPDKLLALIERLVPMTIQGTLNMARAYNSNRVLIPILRGVDGVLSDEQFARFYWPGLQALIEAIIEEGLLPLIWFEADCTSRLKYFDQLPPSNIVAHFHTVDRKQTKKLIDGKMCFWGNVPSSKLIMGTPQQVKDDVKELIDIFGDNGGLIVDGEVGIPDEAKPENVAAMVEAAHEYGTYS